MLRRPAAAVLRRPAAAVAAPVEAVAAPAEAVAAPAEAVAAPVLAQPPDAFAWPSLVAWAENLELGPEKGETKNYVYLVTLSRVLAETLGAAQHLRDPSGLSRAAIRDAVWDAMENPIVTMRGGRPRDADQEGLVRKVIVVRERHSDGSYHFHVGLKLRTQQRFLCAKRTLLERHGLASHWSSSHSRWWSIARYLVYTSEKKTEVDNDRVLWSLPGLAFDPFEDAQEGFQAKAWNARREKKATEAPALNQAEIFSKLDFMALVETKKLTTKKRVLSYMQAHGTAAMQSFCAKHQRRMLEYIEDAQEWATAAEAAAREAKADWELLCEAAAVPCPQGAACQYAKAAESFFIAHQTSFTAPRLAAALRAIIINGPSKDHRVPFLIGSTNTGKSTLVESFDDLFGEEAVFHLPAETDNKGGALRGWLQDKRFVFWDEFEPVAFIGKGVMPKSQFLKAFNGQLFEIQMNQRTNDGNKPFRWRRGAVFTAKERELWMPRDGVTLEDISHIKSRVEVFRCTGEIPRRRGGIAQCRHCLAKWVRDAVAAHDAEDGLAPPPPGAAGVVDGMQALFEAARLPQDVRGDLAREICALGAVAISELSREDWEALNAWGRLRELERRRVLNAVVG